MASGYLRQVLGYIGVTNVDIILQAFRAPELTARRHSSNSGTRSRRPRLEQPIHLQTISAASPKGDVAVTRNRPYRHVWEAIVSGIELPFRPFRPVAVISTSLARTAQSKERPPFGSNVSAPDKRGHQAGTSCTLVRLPHFGNAQSRQSR